MTARTHITAVATALIAAAAGATVASAAHYAGGESAPATAPSGSSLEDLQDARLGPKYVTPHRAAGSYAASAATSRTPTRATADDLQNARLGPKFYVAPSRAPSSIAEPTIVEVPSTGFDWRDASIGAGITAAALAAVAAAAFLATRHRHHRTPLGT